jgi:hypothetical protein
MSLRPSSGSRRKSGKLVNRRLGNFGRTASATRRKLKIATPASACPVKATIECFDWKPIEQTPEVVGMSDAQMTAAGVGRGQRLYWCSECRNVWVDIGNHFIRVTGKRGNTGHPFVPESDRVRNIYLG